MLERRAPQLAGLVNRENVTGCMGMLLPDIVKKLVPDIPQAEIRHLLDELLETKRLPLGKLSDGSGVERKTLERHRKYLVALLLIYTNGYEIIRGHLAQVLKGGKAR